MADNEQLGMDTDDATALVKELNAMDTNHEVRLNSDAADDFNATMGDGDVEDFLDKPLLQKTVDLADEGVLDDVIDVTDQKDDDDGVTDTDAAKPKEDEEDADKDGADAEGKDDTPEEEEEDPELAEFKDVVNPRPDHFRDLEKIAKTRGKDLRTIKAEFAALKEQQAELAAAAQTSLLSQATDTGVTAPDGEKVDPETLFLELAKAEGDDNLAGKRMELQRQIKYLTGPEVVAIQEKARTGQFGLASEDIADLAGQALPEAMMADKGREAGQLRDAQAQSIRQVALNTVAQVEGMADEKSDIRKSYGDMANAIEAEMPGFWDSIPNAPVFIMRLVNMTASAEQAGLVPDLQKKVQDLTDRLEVRNGGASAGGDKPSTTKGSKTAMQEADADLQAVFAE